MADRILAMQTLDAVFFVVIVVVVVVNSHRGDGVHKINKTLHTV